VKEAAMATKRKRRPPAKRTARAAAKSSGKDKRWSNRVTRESDALDLEPGVFKSSSPRKIAESLKRSAEGSRRRKSSAYRSAMSMLTFYLNRAGRNLPQRRKSILEHAKQELREAFGRA
jgi:hypothetical protein